eukprot:g5891.t1
MTILLAPGSDLTKTLPFIPGMPQLKDVALAFLQEEFGELLPPFQFIDEWAMLADIDKDELEKVALTTKLVHQILMTVFLAPGSDLTKTLPFVPGKLTFDDGNHGKIFDYRLGDAWWGFFFQRKENPNPIMTPKELRELYESKFPGNIISEYYTETNLPYDCTILHSIVIKRALEWNISHKKDMVVVHLRLGDVVTNAKELWHERKRYHYTGISYLYTKKEFTMIANRLKKKNIKDITVMGSSVHSRKMEDHKESIVFKNLVVKLFRSYGFFVVERFNVGTPDEDFVFASTAPYIVHSEGGYSALIGRMVQMGGGSKISPYSKHLNDWSMWPMCDTEQEMILMKKDAISESEQGNHEKAFSLFSKIASYHPSAGNFNNLAVSAMRLCSHTFEVLSDRKRAIELLGNCKWALQLANEMGEDTSRNEKLLEKRAKDLQVDFDSVKVRKIFEKERKQMSSVMESEIDSERYVEATQPKLERLA